MDGEIKKPMSVRRKEFICGLEVLINNSGLPLYVIEPILLDTYNLVRDEAEKVYQMELRAYQSALQEEKEVL